MDIPGDDYAEEVEEEHGAGEEAHAEGILHGADDGGHDEDGENGVTEVAQQEFGVDDAEESKEEDEDGQFKADAQAEDDGEKEACVFVDGEDRLEAFSESEDENANGIFDDVVVAEPCTAEEEADGGAHKRPDILLFVLVHAGRDEEPDLVEDERAGDDGTADERGFEIEVERVSGMRVVKAKMEVVQRLLDDFVELHAEDPADGEAAAQEHQGAHDALAQLFEVLHQAHAGEFCAVGDGFAGPVEGVGISHATSRFLARTHGLERRWVRWPATSWGWAGRWMGAGC